MNITKFFFILSLLISFSFIGNAQNSVGEVTKEWERAKAYTKEYLDAMPKSGYALKPPHESLF